MNTEDPYSLPASSPPPVFDAEIVNDNEWLLAHALPPAARTAQWHRSFAKPQQREFERLGVTPDQVRRLERILPGIAYYVAQGPALAKVRAPLVKLAKDAHKVASALRTLLEAHDELYEIRETKEESRLRLLQAIEARHPERCEVDPKRVSFFEKYDHREPEALRMLAVLDDLEKAAKHAVERMPKEQTHKAAHAYPVRLIVAALEAGGEAAFLISASPGTPFLDVVAACYAAACPTSANPLRAVRAYLHNRNASLKK